MDIPPPAYSDVNQAAETTDGHGRGNGETDDTLDDEEEYEDEGGFSGSSRLDAMSQPSDDVQSESHEMSIMRRVPMQGSGRGHDWVHSGDERTGGRPGPIGDEKRRSSWMDSAPFSNSMATPTTNSVLSPDPR
ncbi:hypothetical protein FRC20_001498 [Serendipita sp. 405]|nr:hypothetical protein FRC20_001498 [Serendipita sp. 405]